MLLTFSSCLFDFNKQEFYKIHYYNGTSNQELQVEYSKYYQLTTIPSKTGYKFLGLFDCKDGGTQYIDENGMSLSIYSEKSDIILYPNFAPIKYTFILNCSIEELNLPNEIQVDYDSYIDVLPLNISTNQAQFKGWYTEQNGKGTQVTSANSIIYSNAKVNSKNFQISKSVTSIPLYAYFSIKTYTVVFDYNEHGKSPIFKVVNYGTKVADIPLDTILLNKKVATWSTSKNDLTKTNICISIVEDTTLYPATFFYKVNLDTKGGKKVNSNYYWEGGTLLTLPNTTLIGTEFLGWCYSDGSQFSGIMPNNELNLTAKWSNTDYKYISTEKELKNIKDNINGNYVLISDITLTTNWTCISNFKGYLDGNDFSIKKFELSTTYLEDFNIGMFKINSGTINNLDFYNVNIIANADYDNKRISNAPCNNVGIICGINRGTISNCTLNTINIDGYLDYELGTYERAKLSIGSISGINEGIIELCKVSNAKIVGNNHIGISDGQVECNVAGIAGMSIGDKSKIESCKVEFSTLHSICCGGKFWSPIKCQSYARVAGIAGYCNNSNSVNYCSVNSVKTYERFDKAENCIPDIRNKNSQIVYYE